MLHHNSRAALCNPDVLHEVFQHLAVLRQPPELFEYPEPLSGWFKYSRDIDINRRALISAALSCKAFSEPASKALWAVLYDGFAPLFRVFSAFSVTESRNGRIKYEWDESIQPTEAEWARFEHCAGRVRCFIYSNEGRWIHPPYSSFLLKVTGDHRPLFPNLQILQFVATLRYPSTEKELLPILLTPTLETYSVSGFDRRFKIAMLNDGLARVADTVPGLQYIRINSDMPIAWNISFERFNNLRSADIRVAASCQDVLRMLSTANRLYFLKVQFREAIPSDRVTLQHALPANLPTLQVVELKGAPTLVSLLLSSLSAPLRSVRIDTTVHFFADITQLLKSFCGPIHVASLRVIDLRFTVLDSPDGMRESSRASFRELAAPLLHLLSLESFKIHLTRNPFGHTNEDRLDAVCVWHRACSISDEDLTAFASAWPRLRQLALTYYIDPNFKHNIRLEKTRAAESVTASLRRPSVSALIAFAQACPELESLEMQASDVEEEELQKLEEKVEKSSTQKKTGLTHLRLRGDQSKEPEEPRIVDSARLAAALRRLFPRLRGVKRLQESEREMPRWSRRKLQSDMDDMLTELYAMEIGDVHSRA